MIAKRIQTSRARLDNPNKPIGVFMLCGPSGVGKTDVEMAFAISVGVRQINVESGAELDRLIAVAQAMDARPAVAIRVNPNVGAGGHAKITTGGAGDKFGVPVEEAMALYARASSSPHVTPVGLACHIGSQIVDLAPLEAAFQVLRQMTLDLRAQGHAVTRLDLGGGLGVPYSGGSTPPSPAASKPPYPPAAAPCSWARAPWRLPPRWRRSACGSSAGRCATCPPMPRPARPPSAPR